MAARFCSQCGQEVSSTAKFCPNCAAPLTLPVSAAPGLTAHPLDTAARKSRSLLLPAAIAAVLVLAAALAVLAAHSRQQASLLNSPAPASLSAPGVTNATPLPSATAPPLTDAPNQTPLTGPALTNAPNQPAATGPGITNAPDKPAATLPPDVAAYLTFLQGIEQKRVAMNSDTSGLVEKLTMSEGLLNQQTQAASSDADDPGSSGGQPDAKQNTLKNISGAYTEQVIKWQTLIREFRSMPPPASCTPLANRYQVFLGDYTTVASKMQVALLNLNANGASNPADALTLATKAQEGVNADGAQADTALGDLCARYGVQKPFVISPEGAAPSLLGH